MKVLIREPIWSSMSVGIAIDKLYEDVEMNIDYKTKSGSLLYPETFKMAKDKALSYPVKIAKGTLLKIIPIKDFEIKQNVKETLCATTE